MNLFWFSGLTFGAEQEIIPFGIVPCAVNICHCSAAWVFGLIGFLLRLGCSAAECLAIRQSWVNERSMVLRHWYIFSSYHELILIFRSDVWCRTGRAKQSRVLFLNCQPIQGFVTTKRKLILGRVILNSISIFCNLPQWKSSLLYCFLLLVFPPATMPTLTIKSG